MPVAVQRVEEAAAPVVVPEVVQREEIGAPAPEPPPGPVNAPVGAPAQVQAVGGPQGDPEELVKKLFDPLLRRLKIELRLDRERRGRLTDLSH
jgi:hypothetical protein